jgi:hypothetical protein
MKTMIDGVEITPEIAKRLTKWYASEWDKSYPEMFVDDLSETQDCLTRMLIDGTKVTEGTIKRCLGYVIALKDDLAGFIPQKGGDA